MATLKFSHSGEEVELEDGAEIQEACEDAGVPFACTEGVCGTCVVEVLEGNENLTKMTQEELDFLGEDPELCERLACQCRVQQGSVTLTF
jgi:ferredoxin